MYFTVSLFIAHTTTIIVLTFKNVDFFSFVGLHGDARGTFQIGDGRGGTEVKIGNQKGSSCIDACLQAKQRDNSINGVSVFSDTSKGGCWCERNMNRRNSNSRYMSLIIGDTGEIFLNYLYISILVTRGLL